MKGLGPNRICGVLILADISLLDIMSISFSCEFQMKGHGMGDGVVGERALEHAIQMEDNAQGFILETYHAQQPQLIPAPVNVSEEKFLNRNLCLRMS